MARKIDDLGRLVLPAEIRRRLGLREGSLLEIHVDGERIVLTKVEGGCVFCGRSGDVERFRERDVCAGCLDELRVEHPNPQ